MGYNRNVVKKAAGLVMLCLLFTVGVRSQSIAQLLEQLTLDVAKLTGLKNILKDMQEGYQVLDKGYTGVRDIVKGNFNLHQLYLDGLLLVSPQVKAYYKVPVLLDRERTIIMESQTAERSWTGSGLFTSSELGYIHRVYAALAKQNAQCLDRLTMVMTDEQLRMSDAERIRSIDGVDKDVGEMLAGLRRFNDELSVEAMQRTQEIKNIQTVKSMYGNP